MKASRLLLPALVCVLLAASCGEKDGTSSGAAEPDSPTSAVAEPERPAHGERSGWLPALRPSSTGGLLYLDPWLSGRASALDVRGGLLVAAFEDGNVSAYPSSGDDPYRLGLPDEPLPEALWTAKLSFTADRIELLDGSRILALGSGRLALLSGVDGSTLASAEPGSATRFAPATTVGTLALAYDDALNLFALEDLTQATRLPLPAAPASSPASALGRFAVLLMDGALFSVAADGTEAWTAAGLDPRGGLACDGAAWYALDSAGSVASFAFREGTRLDPLSPGPWRRVLGVDEEYLRVIAADGTRARVELSTGISGVEDGSGTGNEAEAPDPDDLFGPVPELRAAIGNALSKYRPDLEPGGGDSISWRVWAEGAASGGSVAGPRFFAYRYVPEKSAPVRFSHSAGDGREVLLAVFGAFGEELVSNVGEHVDQETAPVPLRAGETYWVVSGELGSTRSESAAILSAR
ncbi:MAG: hypothetical protein JXA15_10885 [Spirochaetales bacterium]|nr:hypothetical protein [Spirochaetales bacterium]